MTGLSIGDGLLLLDKPVGPTSHDMVAYVRRTLGMRRVGHTGTLDPFASGLLLVCLGRSTRLAEYLGGFSKEYVATARLGVETSTHDPEGDIVGQTDHWSGLTDEALGAALATLEGEIDQCPPVYSAKKVGGRPAHRRIREGEHVELPSARVNVHEISLADVALPDIQFRVRCSTGTYVRALARDLGRELGVGAYLTDLRRLSIGPFRVENALDPKDLGDREMISRAWVSPMDAMRHLPRISVSGDIAKRIESGQFLGVADYDIPDEARELVVTVGEHLLAVAVRDGDRIRPRKVFARD